MRVGLKMGLVYGFIVIPFWIWVVLKIIDIDKRTKEISNTLTEISDQLNGKK